MEQVAERIRGFGFVDDVRYGRDWVQRLDQLRNVTGLVGVVIGLAFAGVAVVIIGVTIRLTILQRAREISIMRLVGATNWFIRGPFLLEGALKGLLGGFLSLGLCYAGYLLFRDTTGGPFAGLIFFRPEHMLVIIVFGVLLGLAGSLVSVGRHSAQCVGRDGGTAGRREYIQAAVRGMSAIPPSRRPAVPPFVRLAALLLCVLGSSAAAQDTPDLDQSRRRLEDIRRERDRLQQQQQRLQGQVHDVNDELSNLERQRESTQKIVNEIERQIGGLAGRLDRTSAELILAEDNLAERRAVLERRLVDIYKRGPLYTFQALLAAESFGDLLSRYKYLYLTSRQDRALVGDVEKLRNRVVDQRDDLLNVRKQLDRTREEREAEYGKFTELVHARARRLQPATPHRANHRAAARLAAAGRGADEQCPRRAGARPAGRGVSRSGRARRRFPGSISTADLGRLDWPVEGAIVYRFGRDTLPSGGIIRWNGVGIAAGLGTPVRSVEAGKVRLVGQFGTYGLTVVLEHGNGYYSVYSHLQAAAVKLAATVTRGQTIGSVGGENSDYGPHLHFEIRGENQVALDPTEWLRRR